MRDVTINSEPVELYKILKFEGVASSGAMAKQLIADGAVSVNGELELRKRRKMLDGDVIAIADEQMVLRLADSAIEPNPDTPKKRQD